MSLFKKFRKALGGVAKVSLKIGGTGLSVLKPIAGTAALVVPGAGALSAGLKASDGVLRTYNSAKPHHRAKGRSIVAATKLVATQSKDPKVRQGAANGLTLLKKLAAGKRAASQATIDARGFVVPRGVAGMRVA
jgi:hypothetical protein